MYNDSEVSVCDGLMPESHKGIASLLIYWQGVFFLALIKLKIEQEAPCECEFQIPRSEQINRRLLEKEKLAYRKHGLKQLREGIA